MENEEMFEVNAFSEPAPWWLADEAVPFSSNGKLKIEEVVCKSWLSTAILRMRNLMKKGGDSNEQQDVARI